MFVLCVVMFCACNEEPIDPRKMPEETIRFRERIMGEDKTIHCAADTLVAKMNKQLKVFTCRAAFYVQFCVEPKSGKLEIVYNANLLPRDSWNAQNHIEHCGVIVHNKIPSVSWQNAELNAEILAKEIEKKYKNPTRIVVKDQTRSAYKGEWI